MQINSILLVFFATLPFVVATPSPSATPGTAGDGSGLKVSLAVDMVGTFKGNKDSTARDEWQVRETEVTFYAPVDHLFNGTLGFAAHNEADGSFYELHEAHISSSKLLPRTKVRVGQFFLGLGRLNQFHRHDWPFTSAPKVHRTFFDDEGLLDTGVEVAILLPTSFYLESTIGVTNGWTLGHAHDEGEKPRTPTHYARLTTFTNSLGSDGSLWGANMLKRVDATGERTLLFGLDLTQKWQASNHIQFLLQSELWQRIKTPKSGDEERTLGGYMFPLWGINRSLMLGMSFDYFSILSLESVTGSKIENSEVNIVPSVIIKPSEFSKFVVSYNHDTRTVKGQESKVDQFLEAQIVYILGAHPAHEF